MISFYKYRRVLFLSWFSYRFVYCQKNTQKRLIGWIFSHNTKLPQLHFLTRSYFYSSVLRNGYEKRLLIEKHAYNIATIFGVSAEKVKNILKTERHFVRNDDDIKRFEEISEFLTSVSIFVRNEKDIADILSVANGHTPARVIEQRYLCLKEMGFTNITIPTLFSRYKSLMNCTVDALHDSGELVHDIHPLDMLISTTGAPDLVDIINTKYKILRSGPIYSMHHAVMVEFFVLKLNSSLQKILNSLKRYPRIRSLSLCSVKELLKIFIEDIGLSEKKIESNMFILRLTSKEVMHVLETLPLLVNNVSVTKLIREFPIILLAEVENLKMIGKLFQQYNITPEHIMKTGNILPLHPSTISERLKILEETPELKEMKSDVRYLDLILSYKKALERMKILKKVELPIILNALCCSEGYFKIYMSSSEDREMNRKVVGYLASYFKTKKRYIYDKIHHCYMSAKHTSIDEINERINFLERNKVSKEDILNNLPLLLVSEQDLLKKSDRKAVSSFHSEVNSENHSDVVQRNTALQVLLDMMKSTTRYGHRVIDQQIDVNDILQKL